MKKLFLLLIFGIFLTSFVYSAQTFTPIYCNDYSFTCCAEILSTTQTISLNTNSLGWQCPSYATKCNIASTGNSYYIGTSNCETSFLLRCIGNCFHCEDDQRWTSDNVDMQPMQYLSSGFTPEQNFQIKIYKNSLIFTGRATDVQGGVLVKGADGCTFNPGNTYDGSGNLLSLSPSTTSYTVSHGDCLQTYLQGDRHICGNLEEDCSTNSDCYGHTYENQECIGRNIYGCVATGNSLPAGVQQNNGENIFFNSPSTQGNFGNIITKRCDITSTQTVQCCGDNDCGSNAFCDNNPSSLTAWTCQNKVQCYKNTDCGVSTQCDWTTNTLKTPSCEGGQCKFNEVKVDCCLDKNCEEGGFCNNENKCEKSSRIEQDNSTPQQNSPITGNVTGTGAGKSLWIVIIFILVLGGVGLLVFLNRRNNDTQVSKDVNCCEDSKKARKKFCTKCGKKLGD
jgi:hypothetical protein